MDKLPPRTARLNRKTYPDVNEKVQRLGTAWLERLIREAPEPRCISCGRPAARGDLRCDQCGGRLE